MSNRNSQAGAKVIGRVRRAGYEAKHRELENELGVKKCAKLEQQLKAVDGLVAIDKAIREKAKVIVKDLGSKLVTSDAMRKGAEEKLKREAERQMKAID